MTTKLIVALQNEERLILEQLRGSVSYRRLQEIRKVLDLYEAQPPIGAELDAMLGTRRAAGPDNMRMPEPVIALGTAPRNARVA